MKIVLFNRDIGSGGQEIQAQLLANGLARNGHSIVLVSLDGPQKNFLLDRSVKLLKLEIGLHFFDEKISSNPMAEKLQKEINSADIILINNPLNLFSLQVIRLFHYKPIIVVFHSKKYAPNGFVNLIHQFARKVYLRFISKYCFGVVYLTISDKQFFLALEPRLKKLRSAIIANGIDTKRFNEYKKRTFRNKSKMNVLYVGKLTVSKGVQTLIKAAIKLRNKNIKFTFVGSGPLKKEILLLKTNKVIDFVTPIDMPKIYQENDVFVLPSQSESFPLTIIEAMTVGLPIIASDIYGLKKIINPKQLKNKIINQNSVSELVDAISWFYAHPKESFRVGALNNIIAQEKYDYKVMTEHYENFFQDAKNNFST